MLSKPLKLAIILIAIYFFYTTFILKKEDFDIVPAIGPNGTVTDVKNLLPGVFYQRATLKSGISNTQTPALNEGSTCTEFPSTIYIPVTPVDAVCNLGTNNINAYVPITETLGQCPIVNGVPTKTLNKIIDVAAFNNATTTTQSQFSGRDCFTQRQAALPSTAQFSCTSTIQSDCDLASVTKVYNPNSVADSFSNCSINVGGVFNKAIGKWSDTEINTRATRTLGINGGATCASRAASMSATANFPCGPVNASCVGNDPSGIKSNVNSNYNTTVTGAIGLNPGGTTVIDTSAFWSTCRPSGASFTSTESASSVCCSKTPTLGTLNFTTGTSTPSYTCA